MSKACFSAPAEVLCDCMNDNGHDMTTFYISRTDNLHGVHYSSPVYSVGRNDFLKESHSVALLGELYYRRDLELIKEEHVMGWFADLLLMRYIFHVSGHLNSPAHAVTVSKTASTTVIITRKKEMFTGNMQIPLSHARQCKEVYTVTFVDVNIVKNLDDSVLWKYVPTSAFVVYVSLGRPEGYSSTKAYFHCL